ncbi:YdcF family protein [Paenibacillus oenotherae]|uniref:YdcF family protein n=1 Tax=Paenibacillus oenotherae TaxID=1435645 RepID=A0ABS7DDL5_9BACL|nr:YdcF family protein [Paenibacillus oenotherae]MBW7477823.1 YdcF family protein [Paenibacillus oenotherae]
MKTQVHASRRKPARRRFLSIRFMLRISAWIAALAVFWCAYLLWVINSYELPKPLPQADAAVVLGAALWDNEPSPGLRERLDHALELYKQENVQYLILSGGYDHNGSTLTEAEGMRDYLLKRGVPADRLFLENDARSTYENLLFSQAIAKKNGFKSFLIVTHDYHAPRAAEIARYLDYKETEVVGFKSKVLKTSYNQSREVLAYTKWKLDSILLKFGFQAPEASF